MLATLPASAAAGHERRRKAQQAFPVTSPDTKAAAAQPLELQNATACLQQALPACPFLTALCRHFTIGTLCCDSPSRVEAWPDRLEYYCKHQAQGKVHMVMYFRDMEAVRVHKSKLLFKIVTQLNMFTAHYNPAKPDHMLSITFDSHKELHRFHALLTSATTQSSSAEKQ